ncbi:MAG: hypothetical protein HY951_15055 [Bacteroidia bacterium]|nr:hypothetical protein [Bacteroidia bacterium]
MNKEERTILIEQYLDGELQGENLKNFESQLQNDKEFAQDYFLQKEIRNALSDWEIIDLREKLDKIQKDFKKNKQRAIIKKPVLLFSACAVIAILIVSSIFIFDKSYTNDELYEKYYTHYVAGIQTRGIEKTTTDTYTQALKAYDNKQYIEAIDLLNRIPDTSQTHTIAKEYFTGLSYMELKKYDEAIKHFNSVADDYQTAFHENIIWYLGLCYIKTN